MRRAVHTGALLLVLVATVATSAASVAAGALRDVSVQYGRATPRVPLPFKVTEATCRRFTIGVVQQDGAGSLTVEVNDHVAHRQSGVHQGPPIQGWWPRNLLLVGENAFRVTAYVHSRLHVFNGTFQCPSGYGLATPQEPPVPTPTATPREPIVGPPGVKRRPIVDTPSSAKVDTLPAGHGAGLRQRKRITRNGHRRSSVPPAVGQAATSSAVVTSFASVRPARR